MQFRFKKNGVSIVMVKDDNESSDIFNSRGWFIVSQNPGYLLNNFEEVEKMSKIWANHKFKGCKYSNYLQSRIRSMEENMTE